ncbi:MAG: endolytic transglycosylase MltG [Gammaproteobacteria bacterium]|nr:endolytic transglycosylase MltG [Gammaproteobacteria bacterium]
MRQRLLLVLLVIVASATFAGLELLRVWEEPLRIPGENYELTVEEGDTLTAVANRLYADGVLRHPRLLTLYGRWAGWDVGIKTGDYLLPDYLTAQSLLRLLHQGQVIEYEVVLPEGITLAQALDIIQGQEHIHATLKGPDDPRLLALVAPSAYTEGLFFPASYRYLKGSTDYQLLERAHAKMERTLATLWSARSENLPYGSVEDALIMASIIEKETGLAQEREEIAGVFVRRLNKGMRLQTDPTVIYGLGPEFDGNLTRAHLRDDRNTFNTYRHHGLPPTPIALPGKAAIYAALHPAPGDTLFFVARGDGGHVFSRTLAEHQTAVRNYQLRRKQNYRSSPPPAVQQKQ